MLQAKCPPLNNKSHWKTFLEEVQKEILLGEGIVLVKETLTDADNTFLQVIAYSLGMPQVISFANFPVENDIIYRVEISTDLGVGKTVYSTTSSAFPCHTDGSSKKKPYDVVILQCVRDDKYGGDSLLATVSDISHQLTQEEIALLKRNIYPFHFGKSSIFSSDFKELTIRYNRNEIERCSMVQNCLLTNEQISILNKLDSTIGNVQYKFHLSPGDCLLLNNKIVLHGRTAFSENSKRLIKRVRIFFKSQ